MGKVDGMLRLTEKDADDARDWLGNLRLLFTQIEDIDDAWPYFVVDEDHQINLRIPKGGGSALDEDAGRPLVDFVVEVLNEEAADIYSKVKMLAADEREVVAAKLTRLALDIRNNNQLEGLLEDHLGRVDDWVPVSLAEARQLERDLDQQCACWTKETARFGWIARAIPEDNETARTGVCYVRARHLKAQRALTAITKEEPKEEEMEIRF